MSAAVPYVVTVVVCDVRQLIIDAVTAQEAMEDAENMEGVVKVLRAEPQE